MPAQSKIDLLEKVSASIEASTGLYVVDYRGLTVKETQELRRALKDAGAEMKVYKNNIVKIALEKHEMPAIDDILVGTCACIFFGDDPVAPAKVLKESMKKYNKMEVLGGIADNAVLSSEEAKAYAELPSREQLLAQIAGLINGFARDIAVCINEVPAGLARAINAVNDQKAA
ncbi:MAG: 50S ribosomal protein L10 [Atopobiaceae bacterium]|nr:50S ribosomal protein L10 [Olsenella sp.]MBQ6492042.1 50S ribosomal protein L10 [Atopobiaceae bacterium]